MGADRAASRAWIASIVAVGLVLRVAHVLSIRDSPFFRTLFLDPLYYDAWGRRIAAGDWLGRGEGVFFQDALYPYFLGAVYAVAGHRLLVVTLAQAAIGATLPLLVFLAARRWLGGTAALLGAALAALYPSSIYYEGLILKTWLGAWLAGAVLLALSFSAGRGERGPWFVGGLLLGAACLARGNLLLLVPALALWVVLDGSAVPSGSHGVAGVLGRLRRRLGDRVVIGALLALVLGAAVPLGASALRNRLAGGHWVLTTANAGQNFYIGNNPFNLTGEYARLPFVDPDPIHERRDFAREAERRAGRELGPGEVSGFWFRESLRWIREHPGDWAALMLRKLRAYTGAYEIPDNLDYYLYRSHSAVLRLPLPGFGLVVPLGLLGAALVARRPGWPRALLLWLGVYSVSVVAFFVFARFRMAAMPALFPLAGLALAELGRDVGEARRSPPARRRLAWRLVLLLVLLAAVNLPVRAPEGHAALGVARALRLPVRAETTATAHYNLGLAYALQAPGSDEEARLLALAETELREAARQEPGQPRIHLELGKLLARQGRDAEAIVSYRAALARDPADWRGWVGLGILLRRQQEPGEAEAALRRAVGLAPRSVMARVLLGEVLLDLSRFAEAGDAFGAAVELDPSSERARRGLDRARAGGSGP